MVVVLSFEYIEYSQSTTAVSAQTALWATKSGVVGTALGDELYRELLGASVSNATTLVGCLADFWASIAGFIEANTVERQRYYLSNKEGDTVHLIVFPHCPDLYDYHTMFTLVTALEFSKELCLYLGNRFTLALFHPHYKNSPECFSPERHSPFPTAGLEPQKARPQPPPPKPRSKRQRGNGRFLEASDEDDEEEPQVSSVDIDQHRVDLEVLFNSAAALPPHRSTIQNNDDDLLQTFQHETASRRRSWSDAQVQEQTLAWWNKSVDANWVISRHKIAEYVYADVWRAIADLYEEGLRPDAVVRPKDRNDEEPASPLDLIHTFSRWTSKAPAPDQPIVRSTFVVTTKFCSFNAQAFKRFAITVNAALKRLTDGRMFLEVFHPEYVGNQGYDHDRRRSPFPMIQICYEVNYQEKKKE